MKTAIVLLFLASVGRVSAADTSKADKAIADAIRSLERAAAASSSDADRQKIGAAIEALRGRGAAGGAVDTDATLLDFNDNPGRYKGKTLTFAMQVPPALEDGLRDVGFLNDEAVFVAQVRRPAAKVEITINIRDVQQAAPNARGGEVVIVTFDCKKGDAKTGNVATSIRRP